jgi:hypothetical protein
MENNLSSLSFQDLVALEKMISAVCKKYENIAQMNKTAVSEIDFNEYQRATNSLRHFNNKRNLVLEEMETRIGETV